MMSGGEKTNSLGGKSRPTKSMPRGYVRGSKAAAAYLNVDRKTLRSWRDDPAVPDHLRQLLKPRIIRGESYYRLENLDRFMEPANNVPQDALMFRGAEQCRGLRSHLQP